MLKLRTSVRERESSSSSSIGIPHKGARGGASAPLEGKEMFMKEQ